MARDGLELDMDWASNLAWIPMLVFSASMYLSMYFFYLSIIPKNNNIIIRYKSILIITKGVLRNDFTQRLNCHARTLVIVLGIAT